MDRVGEESVYVLSILHRMRDQIHEDPDLFDPSAQDRVDEAIALLEHVQEKTAA